MKKTTITYTIKLTEAECQALEELLRLSSDPKIYNHVQNIKSKLSNA